MTILEDIARWGGRVSRDAIPPAARHGARRVLMDQIGICLAGTDEASRPLPLAPPAGTHGPHASVWASGTPAYAPWAVLTNRWAGDAVELLAGPECVAAAVAAAEVAGASMGELLDAIAVAAEVEGYVREWLGAAMERHGLHPPGLVAPLAAAIAVARLLGGDADSVRDALGTALSLAPHSPYVAFSRGCRGKLLYGGWGQMLGWWAAWWSGVGMGGAASTVEGTRGVAQALLDAPTTVRPPPFDPNAWAVTRTAFKAFPCNRACHPALTALLALPTMDPATIQRIEVATYPFAAELDRRSDGASPMAAQLSIRTTLALALVFGVSERLDMYDAERVADRRVRALAARTTVRVDPEYERAERRQRRARLRVTLVGGAVVEHEGGARWGPEAPATDDELRARFIRFTGGRPPFDPWRASESATLPSVTGLGRGG